MKLMSLIGAIAASALLVAFAMPASAAVTTGYDLVTPMFSPLNADHCVVSLATAQPILFVEATANCDATLAELTGLCLEATDEALPAGIRTVLPPDPRISCSTSRSSPPG